jgi:hypothetical protein
VVSSSSENLAMAEEQDNGISEELKPEGRNITQVEESTSPPIIKLDSYKDDEHIRLTWRSWMVVFVTCFA